MVTKKCSGSERVQPDSGHYLAIEQAYQGAFASHPKGMVAALAGSQFEPLPDILSESSVSIARARAATIGFRPSGAISSASSSGLLM